jgi:hypothetical protein
MKKIIFISLIFSLVLWGCNETWDEYYGEGDLETIDKSSLTLIEFFQKHPEYSKFFDLYKSVGIDEEMVKDQQVTLWVADNQAVDGTSDILPNDTVRMQYHINYLPFINTDLKNGTRIRSLNGVYLQITRESANVYVNKVKILKSYVLKNGVIHIIESMLKSKINMYDYLYSLSDEYSIFRDSVFAQNVKVFDMVNSIPIGVDKTGNTLYDSVFYVYNPLFEKAQFNSEFSQFTALVPNNSVIESCFNKLNTQYELMGKQVTLADTLLAMQWIKEAAFYDGIISDFTDKDTRSSFGRIWRDPIQKIDASNPVELSNGILYYVTEIKIPNNVIISRIKSLIEYWQYLSPEQQDWYEFKGTTFRADGSPNVSILVESATPKPEILPNYLVLNVTGDPELTSEFSVSFPPLEKYDEGGKTVVRKLKVPPGEYNLYMGFHSSGHPYVDVHFANDDESGNYTFQKINENLQVSLSTPWNFDRVTETEADLIPGGMRRWDGLGGLVGVVNIDGDAMASFRIKVVFNKLESAGGAKRLRPYHWSLKPTANNY